MKPQSSSCFLLPCLSLWPVQQCRSPWPSHGASLPPPALWSIVARLPCLRSPPPPTPFAALQISLLSNPSMTGASLKIHHIQITLISFTLFIYFHWISAPAFLCYPILLCHDDEQRSSYCESVTTSLLLFSSVHVLFLCSYDAIVFDIGVLFACHYWCFLLNDNKSTVNQWVIWIYMTVTYKKNPCSLFISCPTLIWIFSAFLFKLQFLHLILGGIPLGDNNEYSWGPLAHLGTAGRVCTGYSSLSRQTAGGPTTLRDVLIPSLHCCTHKVRPTFKTNILQIHFSVWIAGVTGHLRRNRDVALYVEEKYWSKNMRATF